MKRILLGWICLTVAVSALAGGQGETLYKQGAAAYKADPAKAYDLFVQATEAGHPQAMVAVGHCNESGNGTATNYAKAIEWYEKAVEYNSIKACEGLARIYASCNDPKFHAGEKAVKYASVVVRKKPSDAEVLSLLAAAYARNFEFSKAEATSKKACNAAPLKQNDERKNRHEKYLLGTPFPAVATDVWLQKAADRNSVWAMGQLAIKHEDLDGSIYDLAEARLWREKAADQGGQKDDLFHIGRYCVYGIGGSVDIEKGMRYLEKAAELGSDRANAELGNIYLTGMRVPRNPHKAYKRYISMGQVDDKITIYKLGVLKFDQTRLFLRDIEPEELHGLGESILPEMIEKNRYVQGANRRSNYRRALVYFLIAAEQGYVPAMKSAADLCYKGGYLEEARSRIANLKQVALTDPAFNDDPHLKSAKKKIEKMDEAEVQKLRESLLKSIEMDETEPCPKEAARWYFELAKLGEPYFPDRSHENFFEMATHYNELARRDGSVPLLEVD